MHALTHPGGAAEWKRQQDFLTEMRQRHTEEPAKKTFKPSMKKKQKKQQAPKLPTVADDAWEYKDKGAQVQGQFPLASLQGWYGQGFLPPETRCAQTGRAAQLCVRPHHRRRPLMQARARWLAVFVAAEARNFSSCGILSPQWLDRRSQALRTSSTGWWTSES